MRSCLEVGSHCNCVYLEHDAMFSSELKYVPPCNTCGPLLNLFPKSVLATQPRPKNYAGMLNPKNKHPPDPHLLDRCFLHHTHNILFYFRTVGSPRSTYASTRSILWRAEKPASRAIMNHELTSTWAHRAPSCQRTATCPAVRRVPTAAPSRRWRWRDGVEMEKPPHGEGPQAQQHA